MRVAFTLIGGSHWLGGQNYLMNLFKVLRQYPASGVTPVLFAGTDAAESAIEQLQPLLSEPVVRSSLFNQNLRMLRNLLPVLFGKHPAVERLFLANDIDLVFENAAYYGWRLGIPVLAWIPDLQHRRLPGLFSAASYWKREIGFVLQVKSDRTIMVSSETTRRECEEAYPDSKGRVFAVPFAVQVNPEILRIDPEETRLKYGLPPRFVYLPNQFWKHKNHLVVIEALRLLGQQGVDLTVAASGQPFDPRHPEYFQQLKNRINEYALDDNFRLLGMIPYPDLISLMRTSAAVINPSLSEGWSTTVEEAKALGIPLVLSDIAVHREQAAGPEGARFFDPGSPVELGKLLEQIAAGPSGFRDRQPHPRPEENRLLRAYAERFSAVARIAARKQA